MSEENTETTVVKTKKPAEKPVSHNAALVEFPRDEWGFTTDLRAAGLRAASSVLGNADKHALFVGTLRVLAQHAQARLAPDAAGQKAYGEQIEARNASSLHRIASRGIQPTS